MDLRQVCRGPIETLFTLDLTLTVAHTDELGAFDLRESQRLHSLELMTSEVTPASLEMHFARIIRILTTSIPDTLRHLTITFTSALPSSIAQTWDHQDVVLQCQLLEDVILALATLRLTISVRQAKNNRIAFWKKIIHTRFSRLHHGRLLQVECSPGRYPIFISSLSPVLHALQ